MTQAPLARSSAPRSSGQVARGAPPPLRGTVLQPGVEAPPPPGARVSDVAKSAFEGTQGRMRIFGVVAALFAAFFGVIGGGSLWSAASALQRADHNTAQVVRVLGIYADLLEADADATSAFLVGGLESPQQRADYDASLGRVATNIAVAAQEQPADGEALGALNQQVQTYAANVEQARAYNRQGLPVGATYLSNASASLRSSALPILDRLIAANKERAATEFASASRAAGLVAVGLISLVALAFVMVWLARRTHRYLNVPLAVGAVLVLAALLLGSLTLRSVGSQVQTAQNGDFASTVALATARSAAFDAKSNESLTLIARGSGQQYEKAWQTKSASVTSQIGRASGQPWAGLQNAWSAYTTAHQAIRKLDDSGQWDQAVAAAGSSEATSANTTFAAFDTQVTTALSTAKANTEAALLAPVTWANIAGWVLLVLCLAAALLAIRGVGQRAEEYR